MYMARLWLPLKHLYNASCSSPSYGAATSTYASAVQFFAAAQCLVTEGIYSEANVRDSMKFDFIIVGAGSSGSVLANRLSEVKDWNILLIEAGSDPPIEASIPYFHNNMYQTKYNWGYKTTNDGITNQANLNGSINWPRGKMFGGCSNINAMTYIQGNPEDYKKWYDGGNKEWSVKDVRRCFKKAENFQDIMLDENPEINKNYGHNGPLVINTFNSTYRNVTDKILSSWNEMGFTNVPDLNVAKLLGSGIMRVTASNGERNSVSKAYLRPVKLRKNLKIMKKSLVTKILINPNKKAYGVLAEKNKKKIKIYANYEVIISAGAINSPQLLMLSGIGPQKHLNSKNIQTVVNLPMVGQNLKDHIFLPITIYTNESNTETEADIQFQAIQYFYNRTGYLAQISFLDILAFFALDKEAKYPDFELYVAKTMNNKNGLKKKLVTLNRYKDPVADSIVELNKNYTLYEFYISLLHPHSSGNISLISNNPHEFPSIYPNYFNDARDLELTVSGIEEMLKVLNTTFFKSVGGFLGRVKWPECDKFELRSRDYLKCIAKNIVGTVYHPIGTCQMGSNSSNSVVNSLLNVHGIANLRVVDASIMPSTISGNTNGPCVMIGERAAEIIKEYYNKIKNLSSSSYQPKDIHCWT